MMRSWTPRGHDSAEHGQVIGTYRSGCHIISVSSASCGYFKDLKLHAVFGLLGHDVSVCQRQGSLLLDFLLEPLYIACITVAVPLSESVNARARKAKELATEAVASSAVLIAALCRAFDARVQPLESRLKPPFERRPPQVAVDPAPPGDSCFRPTAGRRVPSGASSYALP